MNLKLLRENFEMLADAPDGVPKLRELILQLAVQGKLVPQEPKDEPASVLLEKIKAEKKRLIKKKKIKKLSLPPKFDEVLYNLPKGWKWTKMTEVVSTNENSIKRGPFGSSIKKAFFVDEGYKVYEQKNAIYNDFSLGNYYINVEKFNELKKFEVKPYDILISCSGTIGKVATAPKVIQKGILNQALLKISLNTKILLNEYFAILFPAFFMRTNTLTNLKGTAIKNIVSVKILKLLPFPLPPIVEQKRIITKVNQLMAFCDELEARKQKKTKTRIALNEAALDKLLAARTPKTFKKHRQFIRRNFDLLYDHPQNVSKLRQAILQLAVQGRLVPQNPDDEPASVLLENIKAEKERLIKAKKIRRMKPLPPIGKDEIPYPLPDGWEWTRLVEICLINPRNKIDDEKEVAFIPMKLVPTDFGGQIQHETRQWKNIKKGFTHFAEGDVAIAKITPCFQNRKSAIMRHLKNDLGAGTTELVIFRPINKQLIPEYILIYLKSPKFIINGVNRMTGSAGQKRVPKVYFSENPFPLPPLPEQKRIVTKVDQLMAICNRLEEKLSQSQSDCDELLCAIVTELT